MDVNLRYEHDKLGGEKYFWFKNEYKLPWIVVNVMANQLQAICMDVNTIKWQTLTFDLSVLKERITSYIAWPSKPKLWLIEVEQISTKPICMDDNLWHEHDKLWGEKYFWFNSAMWKSGLQAT